MATTSNDINCSTDKPSGLEMFGTLLVRVIVPAWILAGVLFKFASRDPSLLPKQFRAIVTGAGVDLKMGLAMILAIECAAILIMLFVPKLARLMAVLMLASFVLVLLNEMIAGNLTNCGCLGSYSPPPWLMMAIDVGLLILVVAIRPATLGSSCAARLGWVQASIFFLVASLIAFTWVLDRPNIVGSTLNESSPQTKAIEEATETGQDVIVESTDPVQTNETEAPTPAGQAAAVPSRDWYELDASDWVGKNVRDIDLVQYVRGLPNDIEQGEQYIIFYSRTCDHCQMLLDFHFGFGVPVPTTLVAVPENQEGFEADGILENPCLDCQLAELPIGVNWIMTPPLVLAVRDGEVICAKEAEDSDLPECLPFN
ncbi:MAG: hypothetical protein MK089_05090 [Phycisphaerales bacterium]|nr:hypothetical protein [Phycisphaerales bacterium]